MQQPINPPKLSNNQPVSLYIHIPFCHKICPYCAFVKTQWNEDGEQKMIDALCTEAKLYEEKFGRLPLKTIFMGGGTPSSLSEANLTKLLTAIQTHFIVPTSIEKTMEMNPESVSHTTLKILKQFNFNRLSFGVQSFIPEELKFLGRAHSPNRLEKVVDMIRSHDFHNFNLDLMFGLPISTPQWLETNLKKALSFNPTHLSTYALTIEAKTEFKKRQIQPLNSDQARTHYTTIRKTLKAHQFDHYEVSAFAKKGFQSQHNLTYWNLDPFIGLGPSGASFFEGIHYTNTTDLAAYVADPTPPVLKKSLKKVSQENILKDFLVANLRRPAGIPIKSLQKRFSPSLLAPLNHKIAKLQTQGFLRKIPHRLQITTKGLYILDSVLMELL